MRTFCFVCVPAPGHSTMISSLASVLVAKANATPEKVVPLYLSASHAKTCDDVCDTYKVDADNQLRFAPVAALDLRHRSLLLVCWM